VIGEYVTLEPKIRINRFAAVTIFFTLAFCIGDSNAQDIMESTANSNYLGVVLSGNIASYREDLLVPLGFDGPGFALGAIYTRRRENSDLEIRMKLGMAFLKNRFSHKGYGATLEIRSAWTKRISYNEKYGELRGGFCLPVKMNNLFIASWDDSHLYWLTYYSLGPACKWKKKLSSEREFSIYLEIPAISLISRPPEYRYKKQEALTHLTYHFSEPNKFLKLELPDVYRAIFIKANFARIMNHALLGLGLEFEYNYCREPKNIYSLNTAIVLAYQWETGL
jgi:hypothetical protein